MAERNRAQGGRLERVSGSLLVKRFTTREPEMYRVVETVVSRKLTGIDKAALCELAQTAMDLDYEDVEGDFVEAGCGLVLGAAVVMAHAKRRSRPLVVYGPFSAPGSAENAKKELSANGADERRNVRVVPGSDGPPAASDEPLALAHLAGGGYDATRLLLERFAGRLSPGGVLILDDYKDAECRRAVDGCFRGKKGYRLERKSRLQIIRNYMKKGGA